LITCQVIALPPQCRYHAEDEIQRIGEHNDHYDDRETPLTTQENSITFTKTTPPDWLMAMWKEIDDKTFGQGFDCFADDAVCNLGVADWHGREGIRERLRAFIDRGFTAHHDVVEYWDSPCSRSFTAKWR